MSPFRLAVGFDLIYGAALREQPDQHRPAAAGAMDFLTQAVEVALVSILPSAPVCTPRACKAWLWFAARQHFSVINHPEPDTAAFYVADLLSFPEGRPDCDVSLDSSSYWAPASHLFAWPTPDQLKEAAERSLAYRHAA